MRDHLVYIGMDIACLTTSETHTFLGKLSSPVKSKADISGHPGRTNCPPLVLRIMLPETHIYNMPFLHTC
jgi:hypothetical protein